MGGVENSSLSDAPCSGLWTNEVDGLFIPGTYECLEDNPFDNPSLNFRTGIRIDIAARQLDAGKHYRFIRFANPNAVNSVLDAMYRLN